MPKGREDPAGSAKSQDSVAIYGQSSEGYLIAAKLIFFTPKLRRRDDDILAEVRSRLVEVSRYASSGSLIVFCLPLGTGGANEIISRLEHGMGLICGKDFSFAYSPLELGRPQL